MFDTKFKTQRNLGGQLADAADLVIDFATLGEYGLEPALEAPRPCEARRRVGAPRRSTGTWTAAVSRFATPS